VNVVDSSGWLSYFADEPSADFFAAPISDFEALLVPSITLTEVFKAVVRQRNEHAAAEVITQMQRGRVVELNASLAVEAAACGLQHRLPLADSIIYATARQFDAMLWTQDTDFRDLPGVRFFAEDSRG
jgi:predicted nucleic acid-binding protein